MARRILAAPMARALAPALLLLFAVATPVLLPAPGAADSARPVERFSVEVGSETALGWLALPDQAHPGMLVVVCHGHGQPASVHQERLRRLADAGAVAVAMDYRGPLAFNVKNGSEDTIAATEALLARFPSVHRVFLLGISMGGEVSGMALAARPDLFDFWVDVEGLSNLFETWAEATAAGSLAGEASAAREIEDETGGKPWEVPEAYVARSPALLAPMMTGLKGAVVVHAVADGKVPFDQGREMATALGAQGVPRDVYTVLRGDPQDTGTTLFGVFGVPNPLGFAGHGGEQDLDHIVIRTGDEALAAMMASPSNLPHGYHEYLVDQDTGTVPLL